MHPRRGSMGRVCSVSSCGNWWSSQFLWWTFQNPQSSIVEGLQCQNYTTSNAARRSLLACRPIHFPNRHKVVKNTSTSLTSSHSKWHQSLPSVRTNNEGQHSYWVSKNKLVRKMPPIRPSIVFSKCSISLGCQFNHFNNRFCFRYR